jgi:hypothetical protein
MRCQQREVGVITNAMRRMLAGNQRENSFMPSRMLP